ncbi:glycoside hydrolase family 15 [Georgenia alba]|uniref:Glycoside hydrolase family 15 n=1 Tax=Georgenia alba TaxID=2233858 RepID=A0ABW2Q5N1_9MICO
MTLAELRERSAPPRAEPRPPGPAVPRRRRALSAALGILLLTGPALWVVHHRATEPTEAFVDLYLDGVHVRADGTVADVAAHRPALYLPGSRVLARSADDPQAWSLADAHRDWLASGTVPGAGTRYEGLVTDALLDMHTLVGGTFPEDGSLTRAAPGAAVAAWTDRWRYVWPRDASFVAAALATAGHPGDSLEILDFVGSLQDEDGGFQARYLPDGSGVPDDRGPQLDGNGWVLWSAATVLTQIDDDARSAAFERLRPMLDATTDHVLDATAAPPHLPPASADYWEVAEEELTLGTVAPLLAGLEHVSELYATHGETARAETTAERAAQVRTAVEATFGPGGYQRYAETDLLSALLGTDGRDAATAMLLPPFTVQPLAGSPEAWLRSTEEMARPAGGVAPGAGWKRDGITWTPQTTLYALTAAENGHPDRAFAYLDWVAAHRTASGAIPEKVLADGSPAAVAPLAWSCANVVLAVAALEEAGEL